MDPILGAGIASAAGSVLGNVLGFGSQQATNKANMKLAQYQYEKNLEMWNRQNEYNSPMAQMQRLKDAGLNPNMVYGNGSAANQASNAPSYEAPRLQAYTNFGDLGAGDVINSVFTAKQMQNIEQQNINLSIDAAAKRQAILMQAAQLGRQLMENQAYRADYDAARQLQQIAVHQARENVANTMSNTSKLNADTSLAMARSILAKNENLFTKAQFTQIMRELPLRVRKLAAETGVSEKQWKEYSELGIRPSDPLWARALAEVIEDYGGTATQKAESKKVLKDAVTKSGGYLNWLFGDE